MVLLNLTCPPSYRLVEEAVSNGTIWSPLPCPPLPSHPQDLTLSDTEQPSLPMVHVFTVPVTTPTTTRVITTSSSYCDPPLHSLSWFSLPVSLSLGHPLPSPSPFYLLPVVPLSPPSPSFYLLLSHHLPLVSPSALTQWEKLVIVVVAVFAGMLLLHCVSDQLWEKLKTRLRHRSSLPAVRFTRNTPSEVW